MSLSSTFGNFDLIKKVKLDFTDVTVSKWKSRVTGLSVIHLDYEAPLVNGYFVVPTEIFNDSGCPHTLEHLVFLGSKKYPYKGIIDHLANRGFSNGTNAWTDTDHTAYTVTTAGGQGFLQLLPIYVDHILYPTMTHAGFVTEVHHIDPKGEDSGVVYSEMQGRQNTSMDLMSHRAQQLCNPPGSAYRSETGGLMEALRVLNVDQIRTYHGEYYVPHNLSLIVTGKLSDGTQSLLKVVQEEIEPNIISHGQDKGPRPEGWKRPFLETKSAERAAFKETVRETVEFPEKDESMGELILNYLGPPPSQYLERKALDVLGTYLTSSAAAPLNKEYIEIESPLCSYIYFGESTRATLVDLPIYIGSIPTESIDGFDSKLKKSFERIAKEGMDMERMAMIINRDERQLRSKLESAKGDTFSTTIISDHIYGPEDGSELHASMDEINQYGELRKWTSTQWTDILRKYYIDPPSVIIRGKPSSALAERLEKEEKARIAAQIKSLGPEGLARAEKELNEAKKEHDVAIPEDILRAFPVPSVKSIAWIPVQSVQERGTGRTGGPERTESELAKHIEGDGNPLPFFVQYDHVQSDFVTIHAMFSLEKLPDRLRPLITAYISAFFALPVDRQSGEHLSHEEVINKLDDETVSYEVNLGFSEQFEEIMRVSIKVETRLYDSAVAWLRDLLYGSKFVKERLQVTIAKLQQSLPEMKRDGSNVLGSVTADLLFNERSTSRLGGIIPQAEFIPKLVQQLQEKPNQVIADFEEIREILSDAPGIRFAITGNILGLAKPRSTWEKYFSEILPESKLAPIPFSAGTLSKIGKNPRKKAIVMSLATIESAFTVNKTKCVQGFKDPEYPALRVAIEVLNATEGYLWRYIRGSGLAYGANVSLDAEAGLLGFHLYRSSNSLQAFKEGAKVVKGLVDGSIALDDTSLDAAKSSIVYGVTRNVASPGSAAVTSAINQVLKDVPQNYQISLLEKFQVVTKADVLSVLSKYFVRLFDAQTSVAVVVSAPAKVDEVAEGLTKEGYEVEKRTMDVEPGEDDEGEDDDDSDSDSEDER